MKTVIPALLSVMVLLIVPLVIQADSEGAVTQSYTVYDGGTYTFTTEGSGSDTSPYRATLYGYVAGESDCVFVQSALDGYPLTTIASGAFTDTSVRNVVVPDSVEFIESAAFSSSSLEGIYFLGDMPQIASDAFPIGVTIHSIPGKQGWDLFTGWDLVSIRVVEHTSPDGSRVNVASLPGEVTVYDGTPSSEGDLTIPSSVDTGSGMVHVDSVAQKAFYSRTDIVNVTVGDGVWIIRDRAFYNPLYEDGDNIVSMTLPDSLRIVMDEAFRQQHEMGDVNLDNVEYLGFEALRMCYSVTSLDISSVTDLKAGAMYCMHGLVSVTLNPGLKDIPDRTLGYCKSLESIEIPIGVEHLGNSAFYGSEALTSVVIPDSVETIAAHCFYGGKVLKTVDMGDSVRTIGNNAFGSCRMLESVSLPDSLESVGVDVFRGCSSLETVEFGTGLVSTGRSMFTNCVSLESVNIPGSIRTIGEGTFKACGSLRTVTVSEGVEVIGKEAFSMCTSLMDVRLPSSVKTISDGVFKQCTSLVTASLGSGVETVGADLFSGCTALTDVYLDGSSPVMGDGAVPEGVNVNEGSNPGGSPQPGATGEPFPVMMVAGIVVAVVVIAVAAVFISRRNR